MKIANCTKCGTQGASTKDKFLGDEYIVFCRQCLYFGPVVMAPTRHDAIREWNELQTMDVRGALKTAEVNK